MHIAYYLSVLLLLTVGAHAQIKTSGIKTHYPAAPSSGNLVYNAHNEHNYTAQYNRTFIPADTYQGGNAGVVSVNAVDGEGKAYLASGNHLAAGEEYHYYGAGGVYSSGGIARQRAPQVLDPAAEFVNKTRSQMASGICYTEVA